MIRERTIRELAELGAEEMKRFLRLCPPGTKQLSDPVTDAIFYGVAIILKSQWVAMEVPTKACHKSMYYLGDQDFPGDGRCGACGEFLNVVQGQSVPRETIDKPED